MLKSHHCDCTAQTPGAPDFVDITERVQEVLEDSGIKNGQVTVFSPADGCTILVNERESGLLADLKAAVTKLETLWPRSVIGSPSIVLPAWDGRLRLGTWQRVMLVELDEPATRPVVVHVLGEG